MGREGEAKMAPDEIKTAVALLADNDQGRGK
jgi:hypothetical protein